MRNVLLWFFANRFYFLAYVHSNDTRTRFPVLRSFQAFQMQIYKHITCSTDYVISVVEIRSSMHVARKVAEGREGGLDEFDLRFLLTFF